ncbi:MAG: hypothetical protein ACOYN0_15280, partial [Phycisphaerales bacterium]
MTLRRTPADFIVTERPLPFYVSGFLPEPSSRAANAVFELSKTSLATQEAIMAMATALRIKPGLIDYA